MRIFYIYLISKKRIESAIYDCFTYEQALRKASLKFNIEKIIILQKG